MSAAMDELAGRPPRAGWRAAVSHGARHGVPWKQVGAVAVGLGLGFAYLALQTGLGTGLFSTAWNSTLGTRLGLEQWIQLSTPLILASCAVAVALRCGLWNIGVDGQLLAGAWAATAVGFSLPRVPGGVLVLLMLVAALAGGAAWALLPAFARSYLRVSEVVTTLILNFVAYSWTVYWITGPWHTLEFANVALQTKPIPERSFLPEITVGGIAIGVSFIVAIAVVLALRGLLRHTHYGFRTRVVGASEKAGRYAGFNARRVQFTAMLLSGAIAGLAGGLALMGDAHSYAPSLTDNTGYIGIVAALLASGSIGGVLLTGPLLALLQELGSAVRIAGVSNGVVVLLVGILILCASLAEALPRRRAERRA